MLLSRICDLLKRAEPKHSLGKDTLWAKWARRFALGIDRTHAFALHVKDVTHQEMVNYTTTNQEHQYTAEYEKWVASANVREQACETVSLWVQARLKPPGSPEQKELISHGQAAADVLDSFLGG